MDPDSALIDATTLNLLKSNSSESSPLEYDSLLYTPLELATESFLLSCYQQGVVPILGQDENTGRTVLFTDIPSHWQSVWKYSDHSDLKLEQGMGINFLEKVLAANHQYR